MQKSTIYSQSVSTGKARICDWNLKWWGLRALNFSSVQSDAIFRKIMSELSQILGHSADVTELLDVGKKTHTHGVRKVECGCSGRMKNMGGELGSSFTNITSI